MKTAAVKNIIIIISILTLASSCQLNKNRSPSSIKSKHDIGFDLINSSSLLQKEYEFELYSLYDLSSNKISFKKYKINLYETKKSVNDWHSQLKGFISINTNDLLIKYGNRQIKISSDELTRLNGALDFLTRSNDNTEIVLRQQIELINSFNQKFKTGGVLSREAALIPVVLIKNEDLRKIEIKDSSFKTRTRDNLKISEYRKPDADKTELLSDICLVETLKTVQCQQQKYSFLFGNKAKAASFNSKIYHYLGYFVPQINFKPEVKLRFDKKFILQNDILKSETFAVLKNGEQIDLPELAHRLWPYCKKNDLTCWAQSNLADAEFENSIQYLLLKNVSLVEENGDHVFGHWSFEDLDHSDRPEIKALLIVGAFTGNYDLKTENNQLVWSAKTFEIHHKIQNISSGFGRGSPQSEFNLEAMPWEIFKVKKSIQGNQIIVSDNYSPIVNHKVFEKLSFAEAQWIVRQIALISENELTQALMDSGFKDNELTIALEKLVSIQKNMVNTFNLDSEFATLASRNINKSLKK